MIRSKTNRVTSVNVEQSSALPRFARSAAASIAFLLLFPGIAAPVFAQALQNPSFDAEGATPDELVGWQTTGLARRQPIPGTTPTGVALLEESRGTAGGRIYSGGVSRIYQDFSFASTQNLIAFRFRLISSGASRPSQLPPDAFSVWLVDVATGDRIVPGLGDDPTFTKALFYHDSDGVRKFDTDSVHTFAPDVDGMIPVIIEVEPYSNQVRIEFGLVSAGNGVESLVVIDQIQFDCPPTFCCSSGTFEQCDPIDVVFILDTSNSMLNEFGTLCASIDGIRSALTQETRLSITTRILMIKPSNEQLSDILNTKVNDVFVCQNLGITLGDSVFALYGPSGDGVLTPELLCGGSLDPNPEPPVCEDLDPSNLQDDSQDPYENWGPATAIVAARYAWRDGSRRIVIPISDEGPCLGSPCCNEINGEFGSDRSAIEHAILVAQSNGVIVSPIVADYSNHPGNGPCVVELATRIAQQTNGVSFTLGATNPLTVEQAVSAIILNACQCP